MKRTNQLWTLIGLLIVTFAIMFWLSSHAPTVEGKSLSVAEVTLPLSRLQPPEYEHFFAWLGIDYGFMLLYTAFYTWALRWLAAGTDRPRLAFVGRTLSWITAIAILFDATENAILWADASLATHKVSPWLPFLVKIKWLSTGIFVLYLIAWVASRWFPPPRAQPVSVA